jgi:HKD family nuclease
MTIELIPGLSNTDIKLRFEGLLVNCISVKGCVAFWTIGSNYFNNQALVKALKKENSFYCVDIQEPTNIDKIAEYVKSGVEEIYLHKYRLDPSQYNLTTNLLHSKVTLFELKNNEIEIWIGSHNLTHYALSCNY